VEGTGLPLPWGIIPAQRLRRVILVPNPAVGTEWQVAVPGGALWIVRAIVARLADSAVVANRVPDVVVSDGSVDLFAVPPSVANTAGISRLYSWISDYAGPSTLINGTMWANGFPSWPLYSGYTMRTVTSGLDVADQWSAIVVTVEQFEIRGLERAARRYFEAVVESGAVG
jgi:hypothetical protein